MSNAAKHKKKAAELELQKQFDKAVASYARAIEVADADGEEIEVALLNKVGDLNLRLGRVADAVASYERAVDHYAQHALYNNAIALCNKILRHAPGRSGIYLSLGRICGQKGMRGDATRNLLEYARRMKEEGRTDEAMRSLAEVAALMPELEEIRAFVYEHAERSGISLPAAPVEVATDGGSTGSASGLVFLDIDYDAPVAPTPPVPTRAVAPPPAPAAAVPPARTSSLDDLLIFDPSSFDEAEPEPDLVVEEPTAPAQIEAAEGLETVGGAIEITAPEPDVLDGFEATSVETEAPVEREADATALAREPSEDELVADVRGTPAVDGLDNVVEVDASDMREALLVAAALDGLALPLEVEPPAEPEPLPFLDDATTPAAPLGAVEPLPFLDEPAAPEPLPFLDEPAAPEPLPFLDEPAAPEPLPFLDEPAALEPLPFLDEPAAVEPLPFLDEPAAVEPMPFVEQPATLEPLTFLDDVTTPVEALDTVASSPVIDDLVVQAEAPTEAEEPTEVESIVHADTELVVVGIEQQHLADAVRDDEPLDGLEPEDDEDTTSLPDDVLAGIVPLRGVQLDLPESPRPEPRPARPVARLNPHDFILPGELPPIRLPDSLWATSTATAPYATEDELEAPLQDTVGASEVESAHTVDAPEDAADAIEDAEPDEPDAHAPVEHELEGAFVRAFSGAYEAIADEIAADEQSRRSSPVAASAVLNMALERCSRLREEVDAHPGDWARRRRLAEALFEAGEREYGLEELAATALGLEVEGALRDAAQVVDELIRIAPDEITYHQKRVELAVRLGDRDRLRESYLDLADALVRLGHASRAEPVYVRVLELDPWDDRARAALGDAAPPPPAAAPPARKGDDTYVSLADWLADDDEPRDTRMRMEAPVVTGDEDADFDRLLQHFREGVARSLGEEDYESHYDLGVAYKEMGLLDDAIAEFQRALRSPTHRLPAYEALGQCFLEQGSFPVAVTVLSRALHEPGLDDVQRVGVLFLLGYACEALQRRDEARSYYQRVYATDSSFRDVADRLAALDRGER